MNNLCGFLLTTLFSVTTFASINTPLVCQDARYTVTMSATEIGSRLTFHYGPWVLSGILVEGWNSRVILKDPTGATYFRGKVMFDPEEQKLILVGDLNVVDTVIRVISTLGCR